MIITTLLFLNLLLFILNMAYIANYALKNENQPFPWLNLFSGLLCLYVVFIFLP